MSAIWFVYGMNYTQNSILNGFKGHGVIVAKIQQTLITQIYFN